jgi:hypothetical protein
VIFFFFFGGSQIERKLLLDHVGIKDAKAKTSPENKEKLKKAKYLKVKDSKFQKHRENRTKPLP